ncbi:restriction endonuclease [Priestia megaterium]|uniref:restriction endonuclease n=1 Tax=Priestia megaterium TaxID=1404 RepID=UPI0025A33765|nr:restriction endonuclease [Priestia megaterium]MDM8151308.1 restriction endonuclease [Priestia megaterium]
MAKRKKKENNTLGLLILGLIFLFGILSQPKIFLFLLLIAIGTIVFIVYRKIKRLKMIKRSNIKEIDVMNGAEFENYLDVLFKSIGYKTKVTPTSRDYGADLIITKNSIKIAVQAKRYSEKVGISAVQQVSGAKSYYHAQEAWVVTNNYFTEPAKKLAAANNVGLIDRDKLIQLSAQAN